MGLPPGFECATRYESNVSTSCKQIFKPKPVFLRLTYSLQKQGSPISVSKTINTVTSYSAAFSLLSVGGRT